MNLFFTFINIELHANTNEILVKHSSTNCRQIGKRNTIPAPVGLAMKMI